MTAPDPDPLDRAADALRRAGFAAWHRPPGGVYKDAEGRYRPRHPDRCSEPGEDCDCEQSQWGSHISVRPL